MIMKFNFTQNLRHNYFSKHKLHVNYKKKHAILVFNIFDITCMDTINTVMMSRYSQFPL